MSNATKRMVTRLGAGWVMKTWTIGATDEYKRKARTPDVITNITAIRGETAKETITLNVRGEERTIDVQLLVNDTVDVSTIEDTSFKAPIFVSPTGVNYDGVAVGREGEVVGMRRIFLSRRRA